MFRKILKITLYTIAFGFMFSPSVIADEIIVSNNGGGSNSSVSVNLNNSSTVNQTNDATVNNDVTQDANTGDNSVSSNNGDSSIETGDITTTTAINNQDINTNIQEGTGCGLGCGSSEESTVNISGNGSTSLNSINLNLDNNTDITQSNSARVNNNVNVNANTGGNSANNNNGDVKIETGNITAMTAILNKSININIDPILNPFGGLSISISNNGDGSLNGIVLYFGNKLNYNGSNNANINNNVVHDLNTGGNTANGNNGAVLIATGNIISVITIGNEGINCNAFNSSNSCLPQGEIIPPPGGGGPITPPSGENPTGNSPPSSPSPSSSVGGPGQVLGAAIGNILPATGAYWILLMTILAITMFLAGGVLRFGSDSSPPLAYAV